MLDLNQVPSTAPRYAEHESSIDRRRSKQQKRRSMTVEKRDGER